ncbi:MAG TPA: glycosyltransferase family 2 protein [Gammaproteobacteria bacterium]|nr:glycosyltransferase family 2 protein [Gammaproteobacteria bacterium]
MIGIVVVNFNTCELALACLASLPRQGLDGERVIVVDNGSQRAQVDKLRAGIASIGHGVELRELPRNLGFAGGCNVGIAALLADQAVSHVLLVNSDAELCGDALRVLREQIAGGGASDAVGARVHACEDVARVDSLGITLYASALASDRKHLQDPWIGPTGGLALYSRALLEALQQRHGYVFDERFFCYAEDTDLALRALLLGFEPSFIDRCLALHHGQASSGGAYSDFVLYHAIRNSVWAVAKNLPRPLLLLMSPLIVVMHGAIVVRHVARGKARVVWRLYRDALRGLPATWRARRVVQRSRCVGWRAIWSRVNRRFYDRDYLRGAWRELWHLERRRKA